MTPIWLLAAALGLPSPAPADTTLSSLHAEITELVAAAFSGLAVAGTYAVMGWLIVAGHMELAVAGTAVIAVRSGSASLGALVMNINTLHEESLYVQDHDRFLTEAAERAIPTTGASVPARMDDVVLDGVGYQYPDRDEPALHEVSLSVPMGSPP